MQLTNTKRKKSPIIHHQILPFIQPPLRNKLQRTREVPLVPLQDVLWHNDIRVSRDPDIVNHKALGRTYPRLAARHGGFQSEHFVDYCVQVGMWRCVVSSGWGFVEFFL